jgi:hypothetical protein
MHASADIGAERTLLTQILPFRIHRHNELDLFDAKPSLDLLLASDGGANVPKTLKVGQPVDLVARCKLTLDTLLCVQDSPL